MHLSQQDSLLSGAFQHHRSGRLDDAKAVCDHILRDNPAHADARFLVGMIAYQRDAFAEANDQFAKAIAADPLQAIFHSSRGVVLKQLGRLEGALASYSEAIRLDPGYADAFYNRGNVLQKLGRLEEALGSYSEAIRLMPAFAEAFNNRGITLKDLGRPEEALASYSEAIRLKPDYADAFNNRGVALSELGRLEEALASHCEAIRLKPDDTTAFNNRGAVLKALGRLDEALGRLDEALASFAEAIRLKPDNEEAHWNVSLILILSGNYLEGWERFEWRLKKQGMRDNYGFLRNAWRGQEDVRGKRLLIHAEQGLGDVIQFCRYLPYLKERGAEIILEVFRPLVSLVSTLDCPMTLVAKGDFLPPFDAYCPIMSLPYVFKTTLETIPADIPYLSAEPGKVQQWRQKLGERAKPRCGVVWSGSEKHKNDRNRSIKLAQFLSVVTPDAEWHSLQKEYRPQDIDTLRQHPEIRLHHEDFADFSDTAALIECLDLVITVDTSVAHAAGAIGKPVWILLPFDPDYRWMLAREDSPWYPTAKLFRQPAPGDWGHVLDQVGQALRTL